MNEDKDLRNMLLAEFYTKYCRAILESEIVIRLFQKMPPDRPVGDRPSLLMGYKTHILAKDAIENEKGKIAHFRLLLKIVEELKLEQQNR